MKTMPNTVLGLIEELEELYPPRCFGSDEDLHDHLRYAGKVELIARLRARFERTEKAANKLPNVL